MPFAFNPTTGKLDLVSDLSPYLKLDQTTPQTTVGRFKFPALTVDTNTIYVDSVNHRLGVGIINPPNHLSVYKSSAIQALFYGYSLLASSGKSDSANGSILIGNNSGYQGIIDYDNSGSTNFIIKNTYSAAYSTIGFNVGSNRVMSILGSNRVGILTDTPAEALHVIGNLEIGTDNSNTAAIIPRQLVFGEYTTTTSALAPSFVFNTPSYWVGLGNGATTGSVMRLGSVVAGKGTAWSTFGSSPITFVIDGSVGINTISPNDTLDVLGTARFGDHSTNYSKFESDGTLVMVGNATVYEDINTSVASAKVPASNTPDWTSFTANTNAYTFKIDDYADLGTIEIPHSYKEGTDLEIHLHLATNGTNNTTARKVKYIVYYTYGIPDNGSNQFIAEASLTAELNIPANQLDKSVYYLSMGTITGTNIKIGTQLKMRIKRIAGTGTEPINAPFLGQLGVHYISDTIGSRTINTK